MFLNFLTTCCLLAVKATKKHKPEIFRFWIKLNFYTMNLLNCAVRSFMFEVVWVSFGPHWNTEGAKVQTERYVYSLTHWALLFLAPHVLQRNRHTCPLCIGAPGYGYFWFVDYFAYITFKQHVLGSLHKTWRKNTPPHPPGCKCWFVKLSDIYLQYIFLNTMLFSFFAPVYVYILVQHEKIKNKNAPSKLAFASLLCIDHKQLLTMFVAYIWAMQVRSGGQGLLCISTDVCLWIRMRCLLLYQSHPQSKRAPPKLCMRKWRALKSSFYTKA